VTACEGAGVDLAEATPEWADSQRVNELLAQTERRVKRQFETGPLREIDIALGDVDDRIAMWNVGRARDAAWVRGLAQSACKSALCSCLGVKHADTFRTHFW
jgi:Family of unknown function (DUF5995)